MRIDNNYRYSFKPVKNTTEPAFKSLHCAKYYLRCADGEFRQVTDNNMIKLLQRKMVTWLNKNSNDLKNVQKGKSVKVNKSETEDSRQLRQRLVRFFVNNDRDYEKRSVVQSVYLSSDGRSMVRPYILTGKTIDLIDTGKNIGKAHSKINSTRNFMRDYHNLSDEAARDYVSSADARCLKQAKEDYFKQTQTVVNRLLADGNSEKSVVNFYFTPVLGKKTKLPQSFQLVNAVFQRFMNK